MLPGTFIEDKELRVSETFIGIFAIAILAAGFAFTGLLSFAVRNALFQSDAIYLPSLISCFVGFLTIFYDFLINSRYTWNTPAFLTVIAASLSTIIYGALFFWTRRKIRKMRSQTPNMNMQSVPLQGESVNGSGNPLWQDAAYYENYVRNMFPASANQPSPVQQHGYDPNTITEEEMMRQQMLMLLLQKDQPNTPNPSESTFRIDWQGQDHEDPGPAHGYYAPNSAVSSQSSAYPLTAISRQFTNDLRPWDGVWRGPGPAPPQANLGGHVVSPVTDLREARRRQIERLEASRR